MTSWHKITLSFPSRQHDADDPQSEEQLLALLPAPLQPLRGHPGAGSNPGETLQQFDQETEVGNEKIGILLWAEQFKYFNSIQRFCLIYEYT